MMDVDGLYSHVFWDWNGTLLDDVRHCIECFNCLLDERGLAAIDGAATYREHFSFPVRNYYQHVGFDLEGEPFELLAAQYISLYHAPDIVWSLYDDVEATLQKMSKQGIRQVILTASERGNLEAQLSTFLIRPFFDALLALDDIHARSKIEIGREYLAHHQVRKGLIIGDTVHDYEVASTLGLDCLLVARGHNSSEVLSTCGVPVCANLAEACSFLESGV